MSIQMGYAAGRAFLAAPDWVFVCFARGADKAKWSLSNICSCLEVSAWATHSERFRLHLSLSLATASSVGAFLREGMSLECNTESENSFPPPPFPFCSSLLWLRRITLHSHGVIKFQGVSSHRLSDHVPSEPFQHMRTSSLNSYMIISQLCPVPKMKKNIFDILKTKDVQDNKESLAKVTENNLGTHLTVNVHNSSNEQLHWWFIRKHDLLFVFNNPKTQD